jgi:hypothetical protein
VSPRKRKRSDPPSIDMLPLDQIDRRHDGLIVGVQPFSVDRFASDVVHMPGWT